MNSSTFRYRRGQGNIWLIIVSILVLLLTLLFYLVHEDERISSFKNAYSSLQKLEVLNQKLETLPYRTYRYIDHDEQRVFLKEFKRNIDALLHMFSEMEDSQTAIKGETEALKRAFAKKEEILLDFEALNASITNSIHVLFDLRKSIIKQVNLSESDYKILDQLIFISLQTIMDIPLEKRYRDVGFGQISKVLKSNSIFLSFRQHMSYFYQAREKIQELLARYSKIKLFEMIRRASDHMQQHEAEVRKKQKKIGITFFLISFSFLFLLGFLYKRQQLRYRELVAFRSAVENSDNIVVLTDADRHIEYVNTAFERQTGYSMEEVRGKNPNILKSDLVPEETYRELNRVLDRGEKWQGELINRRKDGSLIYERVSIVPIFMHEKLIQYLAIKLDVTDYIRQQKVLQQSAIVYENMADGVLITNAEEKIVSCNSAFSSIFGYSREELIGETPAIIMAESMQQTFYKAMWQQLLTEGRWSGRVKNRRKDGVEIPIWLAIGVVRNPKGEMENYIAIYTNLQEIIKMEDEIHFLAYHDSLTGLPNRAEFARCISNIVRIEGQDKAAVFFIDLDRFKIINDTLGHHIGDRILIELTQRMEAILAKNNKLFRIGGDEFVVLMYQKHDEAEVHTLAKRLLEVIRQPIQIGNYHLSATASIGIALYPDHGAAEADLMKHADAAMYHAKAMGQDTYQFYTQALSSAVQKRLIIEQELQHAIARGEFALYYQPQYGLESHEIVGVEALLRWNNSRLGNVGPDQFIPIAEETGLIIEIGYYVFEEACRAYMRWRSEGIQIHNMATNLSSIQFKDEKLFEKFQEIMTRCGIPPSVVELEITERFILEYSSSSVSVLEKFRRLGCHIAIDDFGTGYSSMSYLKKLPLNRVKIDQSFIEDILENTSDQKVIKAIIALSHSLGYKVISEGIETEAQEAFLRANQCDRGQGYLYARPMDEENFIQFYHQKKQRDGIKTV